MKTNFADVRLPVKGERLVGRTRVCRDLLEAVLCQQSCDLMGLRRIGKTSVLREVERLLAEKKNEDDVVLYVDLSMFSSDDLEGTDPETQLYEFLTRALDEELLSREFESQDVFPDSKELRHSKVYSSVYVAPSPAGRTNAFDFFRSFLKKNFKRCGARVFVLIDEFDSCCVYGGQLAGFLKRFRHIVDSSLETGFVSIVATSRSITMLESKTNGDASTLHNVLEHVDLTCFDRATFEKLCDLSEVAVPSPVRDEMFKYSFGHPFLGTLLLRQFNRLSGERRDEVGFDDLRACVYADVEDYFYELRNVFSSFAVLREITNSGIENWFDCLVWRECYHAQIPQHVLATYMRYGFWKDGAEIPYVLREFLFRHRTDIWKELKSLETRFRRLISHYLRSYYGGEDEEWFIRMRLPEFRSSDDPWKKEKEPFQKIVAGMRARRQKELPDVPVGYLDCTYLDDLLSLMLIEWHWRADESRGWKGFGVLFDGDIQKCREQIQAVGRVRNPEAHFVEYPSSMKIRFQEADRYLSLVLDKAEREMGIK